MDWKAIPSLSALRAFESAHRTGSFSAAARELNVTHAAVAQHVRSLEDFFGTPLMRRDGKGMSVTDAGERLVLPLTEAFHKIAEGVLALTENQSDRPLALAVTPAFAENWLMPRLNSYWAQYPNIPLSIQPSYDLTDFRTSDVDLAIRYGRGSWPGLDAERLVGASSVLVASPELIERENLFDPECLAQQQWILEDGYREERMWLHSQRIEVPEDRVRVLPSYGMVIAALRDGAGVGVLSKAVAEQDLQQGRLKVIQEGEDTGLAYWILTRKSVLPERVKIVRNWLRSVAKA